MTDDDRHLPNDWFRNNVWDKALRKAGLTYRVTPHGLRHAHASWLLAGGANLLVVKERLGHGSIATTEKYLHTLPDADDTALAALDKIRTPISVPALTSSPTPSVPATGLQSLAQPTDEPVPDPAGTNQTAPGTDSAALLAALSPDVVRQVLTGLLQQLQPEDEANESITSKSYQEPRSV